MGIAFQVKPFAFDRVFAEASLAGMETEAQVDARKASADFETELQRLRRDHEAVLAVARAEAFQEGLDQARTERDSAVLAAVDSLQASLETIDDRFAAIEQRVVREAGELALSAAELLAARELSLDPLGAIDEAIGRVLAQVRRGQPLKIHVHPEQVEAVERLVVDRQGNERRRLSLTVVPDATQAVGDARIRWDNGGLVLDAAARRDALRTEMDSLLPPI